MRTAEVEELFVRLAAVNPAPDTEHVFKDEAPKAAARKKASK